MAVTIDPTKPVSGNFRGTFAGTLAVLATGFLAKHEVFAKCASFVCADGPSSFMSCNDVQYALAVLAMALIGGDVNYAVTRFSQVQKLKELYDMIPEAEPAGTPEKNAGSKTGKSL